MTQDDEVTTYWCTVTGDRYEVVVIGPANGEPKACTKVMEGVYRLEGFLEERVSRIDSQTYETSTEVVSSEAETVWLEKDIGGYYRITQTADPENLMRVAGVVIELLDDGTYMTRDRMSIAVEYRREENREILRIESPLGFTLEGWIEGNIITTYRCVSGTYSVKERGEVKLLSFAIDPDDVYNAEMINSMQATMGKDVLTLDVNGETMTMSRMDDSRYFCMADGEELILELHEDGAFAMLSGEGEAPYTEDLLICEPGKSLCVMVDGGISFEIKGDNLTISGDGIGGTIILTEVK